MVSSPAKTKFTHHMPCDARWKCVDSRPTDDGRWRKYRCPKCGVFRQTTETDK